MIPTSHQNTRRGFVSHDLLFWVAGLAILIGLSLPLVEAMREERVSITVGSLLLGLLVGGPVLYFLFLTVRDWRENRQFRRRYSEPSDNDSSPL